MAGILSRSSPGARLTGSVNTENHKYYPSLMLAVSHAREPEEPVGRPRIDWNPITDRPVENRGAAVKKLQWFAMHWKVEVFHKILNSGCRPSRHDCKLPIGWFGCSRCSVS